MTIGIIGDEKQVEILRQKITSTSNYTLNKYTCIDDIPLNIDLLFDFETEQSNDRWIALLQKTKHLFVNSVGVIIPTHNNSICRFNGWNTFFERPILEISDISSDKKNEAILKNLGIHCIAAPNNIGLLSARIVAMIINEAYFALEEGISTKAEIDIAMKMGTSYPYGPFEWCEKIGIQHIINLLQLLATTNELYTPSKKMLEEI